jgi:peptide/nickel transport system substrate-binding protein
MLKKKQAASQPTSNPSTTEGSSLKDRIPDAKKVKAKYRRLERISITHIYKFVVMRWRNLIQVREHLAGWLIIVLLLLISVVVQSVLTNNTVMSTAGVNGGVYSEGVIGDIDNLNPIFAESDTEKALSRLMYRGMFTYDAYGNLQMDAIEKYTVSADGKSYEFTLGNILRWSDGREITTNDVIFTIDSIKSVTLASPYRKSFAKMVVEKIDDKRFTIRTSLPTNALFDLLVIGILPKHQLEEIGSLNVRSFYDQQLAVVSGPYQYAGKTSSGDNDATISFSVNNNYRRTKPLIPFITIHTYGDSDSLRRALINGDINAATGLSREDAGEILKHPSLKLSQETLHNGVMALFNTTNLDLNQRQALRLAVDRDAILDTVAIDGVRPQALDGPTFGDFATRQPARDAAEAERVLEAAGWTKGKDGVRVNAAGKRLEISLVVASGTNYSSVAEVLSKNWRDIGADVNLNYVDSRQLQASYMIPRSYDILLTQLRFGANDDSSAYWHSSGANPVGTNYSNYNSSIADFAINAAQVAKTAEERALRYEDFLRQWVKDAPAVALYSPMFYYASSKNIDTLNVESVIDASWRFTEITSWTVLNRPVFKTL